ncbi:TonB-dependent receptor [Rhizorhabdus dicambivorans]|nr:TonB-dependent receptor [Rhizorhabdus dicambivorans]
MKKLCWKTSLWLGAATIAFAAPVSAQPAAAPGQGAENGETGLTDIVVTATRRAESLQRVPIAVTALSGEDVQRNRIQNFADVVQAVPGLSFIPFKGASTTAIQIRGQSQTNDAPGLDLPVAVFIDDIYYGTTASFDADFYDVAQIAVLRGPQGTTFGRNVVGGALQITTRRPEFDAASGEINASLLSRPGFEANGFFNLPLSDKVAARTAFSFHHVDGYTKNVFTGNKLNDLKSYSLRGSLRFQPRDDLEINLKASYLRQNNAGSHGRLFGPGFFVAQQNQFAPDVHDSYADYDGYVRRHVFSIVGHLDWTTALGTVTAITSYRSLKQQWGEDIDATPLPLQFPRKDVNDEWAFSQELRLTSEKGRTLEYILGAYYSRDSIYKLIELNQNGTFTQSYLSVITGGVFQRALAAGLAKTTSFAPYAEMKFNLSDQLAITAGARYTTDRKRGYTDHQGFSFAYGAAYFVNWGKNFSGFTPRAIVEFKPNRDVLLYGSVSRGYKGGGFSIAATNVQRALTPLKPERSTSYELGAKTSWFDRRLRANVALYQADTKDLQVRSLVGGVFQDSNAGKARVKGVELELLGKVSPLLSLGANYAYTHARYISFPNCTSGGANCTGNTLPNVPTHDVTVFAELNLPIGGGELGLRVSDKYATKYQLDAVNAQQIVVPLTAQKHFVNASATYQPDGQPWKVQLFVRNLLNKWSATASGNYFFYALTPADYAAGAREVDRVSVTPPRMFGGTFSYKF